MLCQRSVLLQHSFIVALLPATQSAVAGELLTSSCVVAARVLQLLLLPGRDLVMVTWSCLRLCTYAVIRFLSSLNLPSAPLPPLLSPFLNPLPQPPCFHLKPGLQLPPASLRAVTSFLSVIWSPKACLPNLNPMPEPYV